LFGIGEAYAMAGRQQAPAGDSPSFVLQMLPFALIFVVMYFLLIRPQYKKQKQQQTMIDSLKRGDKVVTGGGIHGTIVGVKEKEGTLAIQVAKDVRIEVSRGSISRVTEAK